MDAEPCQIEIGQEQRRKLDELSRRNGKPASDVANDAIDAYFQAHTDPESAASETLYERAVRTGFLGAVKDGPSDVSTNPKYMEGFGEDG